MNAALLEHYTELVRSEFERIDYWEASNLIDRVREMGIHELDELCDTLWSDLKIGKTK